jgi:hypothetical protein
VTYAYSFLTPPAAALSMVSRLRPSTAGASESDVERRTLDAAFTPMAHAERTLLERPRSADRDLGDRVRDHDSTSHRLAPVRGAARPARATAPRGPRACDDRGWWRTPTCRTAAVVVHAHFGEHRATSSKLRTSSTVIAPVVCSSSTLSSIALRMSRKSQSVSRIFKPKKSTTKR